MYCGILSGSWEDDDDDQDEEEAESDPGEASPESVAYRMAEEDDRDMISAAESDFFREGAGPGSRGHTVRMKCRKRERDPL
ncbi:hypothetical protein FACS189472_18650 [Alphaproteobacteria bacterium]|nr:hypothetical protein FACS189472_18650 [Alphaproteobacteria bacterium]